MKRLSLYLLLSISILCGLSSCFSDEDSTFVIYDDTGIVSFSVGTLRYECHTTSSKGEDSVYWTTIDCSRYKFYIDQVSKNIYNPDSLPCGVDAAKVICTLSTKNNGIAVIKNIDNDSLKFYSESDSIDFTVPRVFRVLSYSGVASRDYTIQVNVHKQYPDDFNWNLTVEEPNLAGLKAMRAFALNKEVFVVGHDGANAAMYAANIYSAASWRTIVPNVTLAQDVYRNIAIKEETCYAYSDGKLLSSPDMVEWTEVAAPALRQLVGASHNFLYAIATNGKLCSSADGVNWVEEVMDTDMSFLPSENIHLYCKASITNPGVTFLTLVGTSGSEVRIWNKVEEVDAQAQKQVWIYNNVSDDNRYTLPYLQNLQLLAYDGAMLAMGALPGAEDAGVAAFSAFYRSTDGGITWRQQSFYALPEQFRSSTTSFALVEDAEHFLWMIGGESGQVWRARINRLGWKEEQKYFGESNTASGASL